MNIGLLTVEDREDIKKINSVLDPLTKRVKLALLYHVIFHMSSDIPEVNAQLGIVEKALRAAHEAENR